MPVVLHYGDVGVIVFNYHPGGFTVGKERDLYVKNFRGLRRQNLNGTAFQKRLNVGLLTGTNVGQNLQPGSFISLGGTGSHGSF